MVMHYYMAFQKSIKRLQTVQNICAKFVLQQSKYSSATQTLMDLHALPIEQHIHYNILAITYRAIQNRVPKYIMDLLRPDKPKRGNMWSNKSGLKFKVPLTKCNTFATKSFSYAAATLWNGLLTNIRECKTLEKIKGSLKTHLYRKAFNPTCTYAWLLFVKCMYRCYKLTPPCKVHITKMLHTLVSM